MPVFGIICVDLRQLPQKCPLSSASMCWYALSASLFYIARNRPYKVSAISMGLFLSGMSPASSASVHGAGMLASSSSSFSRQGRGARPRASRDTPNAASCPSPPLPPPHFGRGEARHEQRGVRVRKTCPTPPRRRLRRGRTAIEIRW